MSRFDDLLAQVEAAAVDPAQRSAVRVNTVGWDGWIAADGASPPKASGQAPADYVADGPPPVPEPVIRPASAIDLDAELSPERLKSLSIRELADLRRKLARALHPDRTASAEDAMKRANAALDLAIRRAAGRPG